ncbi:helix-turn-helix domain-containing protein [Paenibacillus elgii]|uniref:helix-turn-helix domain-containing protein n=1 Tax=Paenibacillus elgii TaxID=189691 RepID=UPI00203A9322|nr:helix-turn-helix transcriptional regulator [Paenibacillus elgii]MCM3270314.1 helix-turn-helix transcriptional regulator [Paenibacillus elgii]
MVINKLSEIMGRKRLKISDVVDGTGLARNTVTELYHGRAKRIDLETLDKLCLYLNVSVGEIFEHEGERKKSLPAD